MVMKIASLLLIAIVAINGQNTRPAAPTNPPNATMANHTMVNATMAPTTVAPTTVAPTTVAPTTVAPTTVAPTTAAPTTAAPTTVNSVAPTTVAPTTVATTVAPTTVAPTTVAPTVAPTTVAPTTVAPTTVAPTTVAPTTVAPTESPTRSLSPTTMSPTTASPTNTPGSCNTGNCFASEDKECSTGDACVCISGFIFSGTSTVCVVRPSDATAPPTASLNTTAPTIQPTAPPFTQPTTAPPTTFISPTRSPTRGPTMLPCNVPLCRVPDTGVGNLCTYIRSFEEAGACQPNLNSRCPHKCGVCRNCNATVLATGNPPPVAPVVTSASPTMTPCNENCTDTDPVLCADYASNGLVFTIDACNTAGNSMKFVCGRTCGCTPRCNATATPSYLPLVAVVTNSVAPTTMAPTKSPTQCNAVCQNQNDVFCRRLNPKSLNFLCNSAFFRAGGVTSSLALCVRTCGPLVPNAVLQNVVNLAAAGPLGCLNACPGPNNPTLPPGR